MALDDDEVTDVEQQIVAAERRIAQLRAKLADHRGRDAADPSDLEGELAASLSDLAHKLLRVKRPEAALAVAEDAVTHKLRSFVAGHDSIRSAFVFDDSVTGLVRAAEAAGRPTVAVTAVKHAIDIMRRNVRPDPVVHRWMLADCLELYSVELCRVDPPAAVQLAAESVALRRPLTWKVERGLHTLQACLRAAGREDEARAAAHTLHHLRIAWLTPHTLVEECDFSTAAYNTMKRRGCDRIRDLTRLSERDFLFESIDNRESVREVNEKLALVGLRPLEPGSPAGEGFPVPEAPRHTFGALSVQCDAEAAVARVRAAIIDAYAADGVRQIGADTHHVLFVEGQDALDRNRRRQVNTAEKLGSDLVLILPEGSRVGVYSARWELTPQGRHPLARRLSLSWPVLSLTAIEGVAYELCWYRDGVPAQYSAHGRPAQPPPVAAPVDFAQLAAESVVDTSEAELRAVFGDQFAFGNLAGLPSTGIECKLDSQPVYDPGEAGESALFLWRD